MTDINNYKLSQDEYNALDKAFQNAHWADDGQFIMEHNNHDYYGCYDEDYVKSFKFEIIPDKDDEDDFIYIVPILIYMEEIDNALCDFIQCLNFTQTDIQAYDNLCKKANIFKTSCATK